MINNYAIKKRNFHGMDCFNNSIKSMGYDFIYLAINILDILINYILLYQLYYKQKMKTFNKFQSISIALLLCAAQSYAGPKLDPQANETCNETYNEMPLCFSGNIQYGLPQKFYDATQYMFESARDRKIDRDNMNKAFIGEEERRNYEILELQKKLNRKITRHCKQKKKKK